MTGAFLQAAVFYALLGAFVGMAVYLWERRHWRHQYRSDLMVYILGGACLGTSALALLVVAAPGLLILRAQDAWSRRIPEKVPGQFPWLQGVDPAPPVNVRPARPIWPPVRQT